MVKNYHDYGKFKIFRLKIMCYMQNFLSLNVFLFIVMQHFLVTDDMRHATQKGNALRQR